MANEGGKNLIYRLKKTNIGSSVWWRLISSINTGVTHKNGGTEMGATAHRDITVTYGLLVVFLVIMFSLVGMGMIFFTWMQEHSASITPRSFLSGESEAWWVFVIDTSRASGPAWTEREDPSSRSSWMDPFVRTARTTVCGELIRTERVAVSEPDPGA